MPNFKEFGIKVGPTFIGIKICFQLQSKVVVLQSLTPLYWPSLSKKKKKKKIPYLSYIFSFLTNEVKSDPT